MPVEVRIEDLRHRLHVESAVCEGAKNAVNIIQSQKIDKKALQQAQNKLNESLQRISLLNLSWQRIFKNQPSSSKSSSLNDHHHHNFHHTHHYHSQYRANAGGSTQTPTSYSSYSSYQPTNVTPLSSLSSANSSAYDALMPPRAAPITGQLEVRLLGCQDLLENVPDRQKRDTTTFSIPSISLEKTPKSLNKVSGVMAAMSGSTKTYTVRGTDLSNEIMAVLRLDNNTVAQTSWKTCSQQAWDQRFSIPLDRVRIKFILFP